MSDAPRDIEAELLRASGKARAVLEALRTLRRWLLAVLALLTVPLWLLVAWPALLAGAPRALLLDAWAIALVGVAATAIAAAAARRRYQRAEAAFRDLRPPR